jgi:NAD(P)-dependent dehydrogenase (short-subunit alcohol dehydrogenase family)
VAIVTRVSRGIGWSTASLLLAEGAHVIGVSRSPPERDLDGLNHVAVDIVDPTTPDRLANLAL